MHWSAALQDDPSPGERDAEELTLRAVRVPVSQLEEEIMFSGDVLGPSVTVRGVTHAFSWTPDRNRHCGIGVAEGDFERAHSTLLPLSFPRSPQTMVLGLRWLRSAGHLPPQALL